MHDLSIPSIIPEVLMLLCAVFLAGYGMYLMCGGGK